MALMKCPKCSEMISDKADECPHCHTKVLKMKTCTECGKSVPEDAAVCPYCGCPFTVKKEKIDVSTVYGGLDKIMGAKSKRYVSFADIFRNTFQKHTSEEMDEMFTCGGKNTTPAVKDIDPKNINAWVYFRAAVFFAVTFFLMLVMYTSFNCTNALPMTIILAAFAVPVSILIFFFEIDIFRSIPFYKVVIYFILGGCLSLLAALTYYDIGPSSESMTIGYAIFVGIIEEVAKLIIVMLFLFREKKANYILDGLLIGAAVGAGFAAFETAGYILNYGLNYGATVMFSVMGKRALLAPGGHVAWAAIEGGALMYVKGFDKLSKSHANSIKFWGFALIPMALHAVWDMPFTQTLPLDLGYIILIVLAWVVLIYLINLAVKQVYDLKDLEANKSPILDKTDTGSSIIQ